MSKGLPLLVVLATSFAAVTPALGQSLQVSVSANGTSYGVSSGGSVTMISTGIGQAAVAIVTVTGSSQITNVSLTGTSFTISSFPVLPATTASFAIQYLPTTGASVTGGVSIFTSNNSSPAFSFNIIGTTPNLALSYYISPNGTSTSLASGNQISFPTTNVGSSTNAVINVSNSGSATGSLLSTSLTGSDFQIVNSPAPATLTPGQQVTFTVVYTPHAASSSSGLLTVSLSNGTLTFPLSGSGAAPNFVAQYTLADNNVHTLVDGATVSFPSVDINANTSAVIQILNQGTGTGTVSAISLSGSGFQLNGLPSLPATIPANQGLGFKVIFAPTQSGSFSGTLSISMSGASITANLTGSTAAASFSVRYIDPSTSNVFPLANNATLPFPSTLAGTTSTITVQVVNSGAGTGLVNSIALSGAASAFQLLNLPALPLSVPPSQQASFAIRFSPQQQQSYTDTLSISLNGQTTTISLQGQAIQPQYSYTWSAGTTTTTVSAGGTIAIADTAVGQTSSVVVTISNTGTADGQVSTLGVTGQGLSLSNLPALPFTLHAGSSQHFTLNFAPTQPGAVNGQLAVGSDTFTVTGTGVGAQLIYTYTSGSSSVPVTNAGVVIFPPLTVGSTESLSFSIQNTGTSAATISTINLTAPSTVFTLSQLPALPMNLAAGATTTFTISFLPNNTGSLTAALQINTSSFALSGNGTQPAALPAYQFQGPSGTQQAAHQPAISLTLASPYASPLQGTLTLTFVPAAFADDSSIQFASGGRTVNFTIPANTTQALFNGSATTIALQTGTTAGNIIITPSFTMPGGFSLTPPSPNTLALTISPSAPQLLSGSVSSETTTSFTLTLSGYSTSRVLSELDIQFSPKQGQTFSTTSLTIDLSSTSAAWFQSTVSQSYGGSFLVAIPFTLSNGSTTQDLVHMLQSLSITAKNDVGTSTALSVAIP